MSCYLDATLRIGGSEEKEEVARFGHTLFLQPVKPRWPCICICMSMVRVSIRVRVSVRVWVRFRVCHDMFRTRSSMFDRLQK